MGDRGEELARRLREAYSPIAAWIESADSTVWSMYCDQEQGTVAAVMHHVGGTMRYFGGVLKAVRTDQPLVPLDQETIDSFNDRDKQASAGIAREVVLAELRESVDRVSAALAALPDDAFSAERPIVVGDHTLPNLDQWTKAVAIRHGPEHLATVQAGLGTSTGLEPT